MFEIVSNWRDLDHGSFHSVKISVDFQNLVVKEEEII